MGAWVLGSASKSNVPHPLPARLLANQREKQAFCKLLGVNATASVANTIASSRVVCVCCGRGPKEGRGRNGPLQAAADLSYGSTKTRLFEKPRRVGAAGRRTAELRETCWGVEFSVCSRKMKKKTCRVYFRRVGTNGVPWSFTRGCPRHPLFVKRQFSLENRWQQGFYHRPLVEFFLDLRLRRPMPIAHCSMTQILF